MAKDIRSKIFFFIIYIIIFGVGFRSGDIYNRMRQKPEVVIIPPPTPPIPKSFYVTEGEGPNINFYPADQNHPVLRFYLIKSLRPILKLRKIKIYNSEGKRIF